MEKSQQPRRKGGQAQRSAARLAAVQALYQQSLAGTPGPKLLNEFHDHRLGRPIDDEPLIEADRAFFDDLVTGSLARTDELDALVGAYLGPGWTVERLDRLMLQILRLGAFELLARPDVPRAAVVSEYVDVAHAFYEPREAGFVNALLDRLGRAVRAGAA